MGIVVALVKKTTVKKTTVKKTTAKNNSQKQQLKTTSLVKPPRVPDQS